MLEALKDNFTKLIALYEEEKRRADYLAGRLAESEASVAAQKEQITELNRRLDNLRLSSAFTGEQGSPEARQRIDKLIHEIDKCISLLEA